VAGNGAADAVRNGEGSGDALRSALEQHKGLLVPAVVGVAGAFAAAKGPDIIRGLGGSVDEKVASTAEEVGSKAAEGAKEGLANRSGGGLAGRAIGKLVGGGGGGGGGGKKTRRLPIQRWTDVAVPVEQAFEAWTQYEQFPKFMHRVLSVEQKEDEKLSWEEKIWFSKRRWEGRIIETRKNDRIVWKTTNGMSHKGVVSFHRLGDQLTRVMIEMEFEPSGMIEKMASGLRFVKRAVQADLARFKAHVEFQDAKGLDYGSGGGDEPDGRAHAEASGNEDQARTGDDAREDADREAGNDRGRREPRTRNSRARSSSTKSGAGRRTPAKRKTSSASGARKRANTRQS
jgi:uncharacterized protein YndB with AHSA1/START domain